MRTEHLTLTQCEGLALSYEDIGRRRGRWLLSALRAPFARNGRGS